MTLDLVIVVIVLLAVVKGYSKGLIMALFNTVSLLIGLAAAVKFSTVIAPYLSEKMDVSGKYLPLLSFALVFFGVLVLIRFIGKALQKTFESVKIGFINRIGGVALYLVLYLSILSVIFYYLEKSGLFPENLLTDSKTYGFIAPWGPAVLNTMAKLVPFFRDMFDTLSNFFDSVDLPEKPKE